MLKVIQIENLGLSMDDRGLERLFMPFGEVHSAKVLIHFDTCRSTGLGIVQMERDTAGERAIASLNGQVHCGRTLAVYWSTGRPRRGSGQPELFGPMNIVEEPVMHREASEDEGLPREGER